MFEVSESDPPMLPFGIVYRLLRSIIFDRGKGKRAPKEPPGTVLPPFDAPAHPHTQRKRNRSEEQHRSHTSKSMRRLFASNEGTITPFPTINRKMGAVMP